MRNLLTACAFVTIGFPLLATDTAATQAEAATVCEVLRQPEIWNGRTVTIRGRVLFEFERFALADDACDGDPADLWLEYGRGPARQPTTWCCGDLTPRDRLTLTRDAEFRKFHRYVTAHSHRKGCYEGQCLTWSVTATLTGRIDAVPRGNGLPCERGFGHFNLSCARLVIGKVSFVVAERRR